MSEADEMPRSIIKTVSFPAEQWPAIERRFQLSGETNFSRFVRSAILDTEIRVRQIAFDPAPLGAELARIGNNINQIARLVNTESVTTLEEMKATRALVREIQALIERAAKEAE
ncbi:plasmid mobilization relaxosome protein MobC [Gulosibacter molinativorax]|uniref:plasmid mobilization relaxosome protein MobC n=1 Tax=Gulosibacter molinativorax TaxID=256821 RepID=UPI0015E752E4|nr:plasmid mobilization relaxosome protein MobC [Gulosibacter molinativorax]QUY63968.1 plasmid mobilization;relaxosome [Gulosibacter molinativorax]